MESAVALAEALRDRYALERELGAGGMATVFLARDLKHHRPVALKVLSPELAAVIGAKRFLQEIETTANLQHPHILPLHDSGEVGGTAYYVMPYVEGESLRDRLRREKQLPIEVAVRIATEVNIARAIEELKALGVWTVGLAAGAPESYDSVLIEGSPRISSKIDGGVHGDIATASITVNSIPAVIVATPGLRTMRDMRLPSFVGGR